MVELCLTDSVVLSLALVLTWRRVGAPLPDAEIQLLRRTRRTWWQHSTYMHCPSSLSYLINSRGIRFFCPITEVGCAFQNQVFSLSGLLPMLYLLSFISKKSKTLRVYLVRLLPLPSLVWLPHLARQSKASFDGSVCFILALLTL
jgi:hypothetical protein